MVTGLKVKNEGNLKGGLRVRILGICKKSATRLVIFSIFVKYEKSTIIF